MTWPLASTAIVLATVVLSLAWYERSRPAPRVIALVATMAALAVVGRIAFAPIPNVKPTTDLIVLSGFAFGAIPGFTVGALTALVSNLFFGQGIHTPWQMLAWGGAGLLGAFAFRLLGGRPSRTLIAGLCALAGLAFGAVMDLSLWATIGGEHTLSEYGAISLRSLPFNVAHAIGNAVFAFAFAPVVLAALGRARRRGQVQLLPLDAPTHAAASAARLPLPALLVAVVVAGAALTHAGSAEAAPRTPLRYLLEHQTANGGFGDVGTAGSLESGWAAMALGASRGVPASAKRNAVRYLQSTARRATDIGDLERIVLGLRALGAPARDRAGRDLVRALEGKQSANGSFGGLTNQTAFGVLALRAAGQSTRSAPVRKATAYLLARAGRDGGFSFSGKGTSGVDDTAGVVQALAAAGRRGAKVTKRAVAFLTTRQLPDGGFPIGGETRSNAQSTAWVVQALLAVGRDPAKLRRGANTPLTFLQSLTMNDGHVRYSRTSDQTPVWVTAQAQLAFAGSALPVRAAKPAAKAADAVAATPVPTPLASAAASRRRDRASQRRTARRLAQAQRFTDDVVVPASTGILLISGLLSTS